MGHVVKLNFLINKRIKLKVHNLSTPSTAAHQQIMIQAYAKSVFYVIYVFTVLVNKYITQWFVRSWYTQTQHCADNCVHILSRIKCVKCPIFESQ